MRRALIAVIRAYQAVNTALIRARFPLVAWSGCRQWPSCSDFAVQAIREKGPVVGGARAIARMMRCSPFSAAR